MRTIPHPWSGLLLAGALALATGCPEEEPEPPADEDGDGYDEDEDCDDGDAATYPGADELCDGLDNDCDGTVPADETDDDGDGVAECEGDCDDGDAAVHPGAAEACNGVDDDCDGTVPADETDDDGDGAAECEGDCDDGDAAIHPGADEVCDGADNDCDGDTDEGDATDAATWYQDADGDGYGDAASTTTACDQPTGHVADDQDCDDGDAAISPEGTEVCDGADNDCDGATDEPDAADAATWYLDADGDGHGVAAGTTVACDQPTGYASTDDDCDDANAAANPGATELCNGFDDDCDGDTDEPDAADATTWYGDTDGDGYGETADAVVACDPPTGYVAADGDCNDANDDVNPGATEWCGNGVDEDCSGVADDICLDHCGTISTDEIWDSSMVHVVTCDLFVEGNASPRLTIQDGTLVILESGVDFYVGYYDDGSLVVDGHTQGVTFTSADQDPDPGDWRGLWFNNHDDGSELTGLTVAYAGANGDGAIRLNGADVTMDGCTVEHSTHHGLYVSGGGTLRVENSTFRDNDQDGIYIHTDSALDDDSGPTFAGNTSTGNGGHAMSLPANSVGQLDGDTCAFAGNDLDVVRILADTVTDDAQWSALDVPYRVQNDVFVEGPTHPEVVVEDGAVVQLDAGVDFYVGYYDHGSLVVDGHTLGVVFTSSDPSPGPGDWRGLWFNNHDDDSVLTGLTAEYGGANGDGTIRLNGARVELIDCVVRHSSNHGLYASGASELAASGTQFVDNLRDGLYVHTDSWLATAGGPTFTGNTCSGNEGFAMTLPANSVGQIDGDTCAFAGNDLDAVQILADTVTDDALWSALDVPYRVQNDVFVEGPTHPELVVEDGAVVQLDSGVDFYVGYYDHGSLVVDGHTLGVVFTSSDPSPGPGDWRGLWFNNHDDGSVLTGLTAEYGGANGDGTIRLNGADVELIDCVVRHSSNHGLYASGASELAASGTAFLDNTDDGLHVHTDSALASAGGPTFTGNSSLGNGGYAVSLPANSVGQIDGDSCTFFGDADDRVEILNDTVTDDATWMALDVPYRMTADVFVEGPAQPLLVVEAGATVEFASGVDFYVGYYDIGALTVSGTAQDPVVFTAADPSPQPGDWRGLWFNNHCDENDCWIDHAVIEFGGANGNGNVVFNACDGTITDSTIRDSSSYGVYLTGGASPTLTNVTYSNNASGDTN